MTYATLQDRAAIEAQSRWEDRDLPVTTYGMLQQTAKAHPQSDAITFQMFSDPDAPAETLNWEELRKRTAQTANFFRELGVGETDVVAFLLPNASETVWTYIGGQVAGIVNPINPLLEAEQIASILRETNAKVLVTLKAFPKTDVAQKAAEALSLAPNVQHVVEVDLLRYLTGLKKFIVPLIRPKNPVTHSAKVWDFTAEVSKRPTDLTFEDRQVDRVATNFHTGGTTGMPKVAQHKYSGIIYNAWLGSELLLKEDDTIMCPLPLFHVFATIIIIGGALSSGAHVVLPTPQGYRGDGVFDNFWKLSERYKATFMVAVPTAISALMQRPVNANISSLRIAFVGAAPLPLELYKRFEEKAGVTICEGYGLTEATTLVSINPPDGEKKVGSIGFPFPYTDVKIISVTTGEECGVDEIGEICCSNPGVNQGHTYTEEAKNRDLYYPGPDGPHQYLRTGDLGRVDPDGYLWITGRAKDLIIRGGHNIDPAEIEEALAGHPDVALVGAVGQPDKHSGEVPCAYVQLIEGGKATPEELMKYCDQHVHERAAQPKFIGILDSIPVTAVGKIFKPDLRRMAITRIYNRDLEAAGLSVRVQSVIEDKKRGLVAQIGPKDATSDADVDAALAGFIRPWQWVS